MKWGGIGSDVVIVNVALWSDEASSAICMLHGVKYFDIAYWMATAIEQSFGLMLPLLTTDY